MAAKLRGFMPVSYSHGQVMIKGGLCVTRQPATTKQFADGPDGLFFRLSAQEAWLCKAVTGTNSLYRASSMNRVTLIRDILNKLLVGGDGIEKSAVAEEAPTDGDDDDDPMNAVDTATKHASQRARPVNDFSGGQFKKRPRRTEHTRNGKKRIYVQPKFLHKIVQVSLPSVCPELDPNNQDRRDITVYAADARTVWLAAADVPWAIEYMYNQSKMKGVLAVADDDTGPSEINVPDGCDGSPPVAEGDCN